jgi:hypothetical protein
MTMGEIEKKIVESKPKCIIQIHLRSIILDQFNFKGRNHYKNINKKTLQKQQKN